MATPMAPTSGSATKPPAGSLLASESGRAEPTPVLRIRPQGQTLALTIIATVAVVFALEWAQKLFISLLLGILFAYTLNPLVAWLERVRIPRVLGALVVMVSLVCLLIFGTYSLRGQVQRILDQVPHAVSELSVGLDTMRKGPASTVKKLQTAATAVEKATSLATVVDTTRSNRATRVVMDPPARQFGNFLWLSSLGAAAWIGEAVMVLFLTFFLLISGDTYKRKLVRLSGPAMSSRRITVRILDDINESIQRYMFMLLVTNVQVGLLTWIALRWIGLENAGAWAVAASMLHIIPYFGPAVTAAGIGMAAFMQFDALSTALLVACISLAIATLIGTVVTTWMTGRIARMNTAAVFIAILFWAWLWGIWGMLLSIPITVIMKVMAQHVENLEAAAELLGE